MGRKTGRKGKNAEKHMIKAHYIHVWKFSNEFFIFAIMYMKYILIKLKVSKYAVLGFGK